MKPRIYQINNLEYKEGKTIQSEAQEENIIQKNKDSASESEGCQRKSKKLKMYLKK